MYVCACAKPVMKQLLAIFQYVAVPNYSWGYPIAADPPRPSEAWRFVRTYLLSHVMRSEYEIELRYDGFKTR